MKTSLKHKGLAIVSSVSIILQIMLPALSVASLYSPVPARAGVCSPGQWGAPCGGNDCPGSHSAQCRGDGSGWDCIWNPAQCGAQQQAPAGGAGASEWDKCKREGKSDEECRGRAEGAYIERAQDIPPTEREKAAARAGDDARKKALEQIEAKTEGGSSEGLNAQEYVAIQEAAKTAVEQVQEKNLTLERDQAEIERIATAIGQATGETIQKEREPKEAEKTEETGESAPEREPPEPEIGEGEDAGRVGTTVSNLGKESQPCRPGKKCDAGLECKFIGGQGNICTAPSISTCGREGERCCARDQQCFEPLECRGDICTRPTGREEARRSTGLPTRPAGEFEESRGRAVPITTPPQTARQIIDNSVKSRCDKPVGGGKFTDPTTGAERCYRCTGAASYEVYTCPAPPKPSQTASTSQNTTPVQRQISAGGREEARRSTGLPTRPAGEFEESRRPVSIPVTDRLSNTVRSADSEPTVGSPAAAPGTQVVIRNVGSAAILEGGSVSLENGRELSFRPSGTRDMVVEIPQDVNIESLKKPGADGEVVTLIVRSKAGIDFKHVDVGNLEQELPQVLGYLPILIRDAQGNPVKATVEVENQEGVTGASGAYVARGLRTGRKYKVTVKPEDGSAPIEKECPAVPFVDEHVCEFKIGARALDISPRELLEMGEKLRQGAVEKLTTFIAGKIVGQDRYKSAVTDDGHLQYTIRHVGVEREFSEDAKARIVEDVRQKWPNSQIEEKFDEVIAAAEGNNVDPLFALTIWVEESAAGGVPSKSQFGCFPGGDISQQVPFETSMSCFVGEVNKNYDAGLSTPENFENFMFNYCGHPDIRCDNNRNFPANVRDIYVRLLELLRSQESGEGKDNTRGLSLVPQVLAQEAGSDPLQATVTLIGADGSSHTALSDEQGRYILSAPAGVYKLIVSAPGNKSVSQDVVLSGRKLYAADVQLEEGDTGETGGVAGVREVAAKVQLQEGWNAVSPGLVPNHVTTAGELLTEIAAQGGYATTVAQWKDGRWQQFVQRATTTWGQDFPLSATEGYFIRVHMPVELVFPGEELESVPEYSLKKGYNFVGVVSDAQLSADSLIESINKASQVARTVTRFEAGLYEPYVKLQGIPYGEDFLIEETRGYFIRVEEDVTWSP